MVGGTGVEGGIGIVIDTDNLWESGVFGTAGYAAGANVGVAIAGGFAIRDIEGWSYNVDANVGAFSPVVSFDDCGFNGLSLGIGPGKGLSASATHTWTFSADDLRKIIKKIFSH